MVSACIPLKHTRNTWHKRPPRLHPCTRTGRHKRTHSSDGMTIIIRTHRSSDASRQRCRITAEIYAQDNNNQVRPARGLQARCLTRLFRARAMPWSRRKHTQETTTTHHQQRHLLHGKNWEVSLRLLLQTTLFGNAVWQATRRPRPGRAGGRAVCFVQAGAEENHIIE